MKSRARDGYYDEPYGYEYYGGGPYIAYSYPYYRRPYCGYYRRLRIRVSYPSICSPVCGSLAIIADRARGADAGLHFGQPAVGVSAIVFAVARFWSQPNVLLLLGMASAREIRLSVNDGSRTVKAAVRSCCAFDCTTRITAISKA